MKITVELLRAGASRVSMDSIPLQAYVLQGGSRGKNLLDGERVSDVEYAKTLLATRLTRKMGNLEINWLDRTGE